jgi:putative transposase
MKHQWLFLNTLDSVAALRRHVAFYVAAHNTQVPHSAFLGQTPDEMYSGTGEQVSADLASAKSAALDARLNANRLLECERCARRPIDTNGDLSAAA